MRLFTVHSIARNVSKSGIISVVGGGWKMPSHDTELVMMPLDWIAGFTQLAVLPSLHLIISC